MQSLVQTSGGLGGGVALNGGGREEAASRATAVLPSGAGKTVLALRVAESLRPMTIVYLVPSRDLVSQSYRDWERWREARGHLDGMRALGVCSSTSVPAEELPRTTDASAIADFLRRESVGPRVIFCTYHSARRVGEALEGSGATADLLVCDEVSGGGASLPAAA